MRPLGYAVSLIAVGSNDEVKGGVPLAELRLPSLETGLARAWLDRNRYCRIFAVPGDVPAPGRPEFVLGVTPAEYREVVAGASK
jgi:hypothetical protein